jgi:hypothetical protein
MLCNHCHGKHVLVIDGQPRPCEECGGAGLIHCCEGLQAQPEPIADRQVYSGEPVLAR